MKITRRRLLATGGAALGLASTPARARHGTVGVISTPLSGVISNVAWNTSTFYYNVNNPPMFVNSDVWANTWADDNNIYCINDDAHGWNGVGPGSNMQVSLLSDFTPAVVGSNVNYMSAWGGTSFQGTDGATFKAMGMSSVHGALYIAACRQIYANWGSAIGPAARQTSANCQIIKSTDHGLNWTPIPPSTGEPYVSPMFSGLVNNTCWFVQYGKDYVGQTVDRSDTFVYAVSNDGYWNNGSALYLGRVLISDLPSLNGANWSYYQGGDGSIDANWGAWGTAAPLISSLYKVSSNGVQWLPAFNCYIHIQWWYTTVVDNIQFGAGSTQWDVWQAQHVWGPWTMLGSASIVWDHGSGSTGLYNPNVMPKSLSVDGGRNIVVSCAGSFDNFAVDYTLIYVTAALS